MVIVHGSADWLGLRCSEPHPQERYWRRRWPVVFAISSINPTPMRASISQPAGINALDATINPRAIVSLNGTYYARWPYPLTPDPDVTVSLSVVYPLPIAGATWMPKTFYPAGSVISLGAPIARGHYFTALTSGMSGATKPPVTSLDLSDGTVTWTDLGTATPAVKKPDAITLWEGSHDYKAGDVIQSPWNAHFLLAMKAGRSGATPPIGPAATVQDSQVTWQDAGINPPADQDIKRRGPPVSASFDGAGQPTRAALAATTTPDQVITVVNQALPHVHALSTYNLSAGVVYSSTRNRSFGFNTSNSAIQTGSMPNIDPAAARGEEKGNGFNRKRATW
jgi:hypothetical protein